jgi:hypothetical protein
MPKSFGDTVKGGTVIARKLQMLEFVWATRSRSGSQFVVKLTEALLGSRLQPQSRITGARRESLNVERDPSFHDLLNEQKELEYFSVYDIRSLKLEDPGLDDLAGRIFDVYPNSKWMASHRKLEDIIISHFNIKKWGHNEQYVLKSFRTSLTLYERLAADGRIFVLDVDKPNVFRLEAFASFLGCQPTEKAAAMIREWKPVNDLAYQKQKYGERFTDDKEIPPGINNLRDRCPWIDEFESRYDQLVTASSQLHSS